MQWWSKGANQIVQPFANAMMDWNAPEHMMVAFLDGGRVMVADQFGVRAIANAGLIDGVANEFTVSSQALLVGDGALMRGVTTLESAGSVLTGARGGASWFASSFGIEMVVVDARTAGRLDTTVRQILGRPPRDWTFGSGDVGPSPGDSGGGPALVSGGNTIPLSRVTGLVLVALDETPQTVVELVQSINSFIRPGTLPVTPQQVLASLGELQQLGAARMVGNGFTSVPGKEPGILQPGRRE
jgi:hypothetical protein